MLGTGEVSEPTTPVASNPMGPQLLQFGVKVKVVDFYSASTNWQLSSAR